MALAAYLCAQYNQAESIYVESRDRLLISVPPTGDLIEAIAKDSLESTKKSFQEERFRVIDVPSYVALYGREVSTSIQADELNKDQIDKAHIIAQHYSKVRNHLNSLQREIREAYEAKTLTWPFQMKIKKLTQIEREALEHFAASDILSWNSTQHTISCEKEQRKFLNGEWIEVFKIRAIQRDLGGVYAQSFFIRSGEKDDNVSEQAKFYGINRVINADDMPRVVEIVAQHMGIQ